MKRRHFVASSVGVLGCAGCAGRESDRSEKEEFRDIPDTCSSENEFSISVGNNTDRSITVGVSLFKNDTELLYREVPLTEDGTEDDGSSIPHTGCRGEDYSVRVDPDGREPVEEEFTADPAGYLVVLIQPDDVSIYFFTTE